MGLPEQRRPPDMEALVLDRLRSMSPAKRFQMMLDLNRFVAETQVTTIRQAHPDADEFELKMRLASGWIKNPELLKAAPGMGRDGAGLMTRSMRSRLCASSSACLTILS